MSKLRNSRTFLCKMYFYTIL